MRFSDRLLALTVWAVLLALAAAAAAGDIHDAVKAGDVATVRDLLEKVPKLAGAKDKNKETPLHEAARRGHKEIAAVLIAQKAEVDARNGRSYQDKTPLIYAVLGGHREVAELLLQHGADVNAQDGTWLVTSLHEAVAKDDVAMVKLLLKHKANPNIMRRSPPNGCTPLYQAKTDAMRKLLLAHGADINVQANYTGRSPLWTVVDLAVRYHQHRPERIRFLLDRGADINLPDKAGLTPLHRAVILSDRETALAGQLLAAKADVNARSFDGRAPLHLAAQHGGRKIVAMLLAARADAGARDDAGRTLLHSAAAGAGRVDIVKLLLKRKLDPNAADRDGRTPLFAAAGVGEKAVVEALLAAGADPSVKDNRGRRPLHEAARLGRAGAAAALLAGKAEPNAPGRDGQTSLHLAARGGHLDAVEALLAGGADVNAANRWGERPLLWPTALGLTDVAKVLVAKGAKLAPAAKLAPLPRPVGKGPKAAVADFIVKHLKLGKGIALDVGCGDGQLAIEIARRTALRVRCVDPDAAAVGRVRQAIDAAGLYGVGVTAEPGRLDKLAYPPHCASLIVCGDEFAGGKGGRDFGEIYRTLSPNGVAMLGQSAAAAAKGRKLTRKQLEGWLKQAGIDTYTIIEAGGVWAKVTRPRPAGSDEWRYRDHDPGKSCGSNDTLVGNPLRTHWISGWRPGVSAASIVLGDGRMFSASLEYQYRAGRSRLPTATPYLQAIDAYTGIELWARAGRDQLPYSRTLADYGRLPQDMVLADGALYVLGGKSCVEFDPDDGSTRRVFNIPAEAGADAADIWLYLCSVGEVLYGSVGPSMKIGATWSLKYPRGNSKAVFALDRSTGRLKWIHKTPTAMTGSLAIGEGKLFFCDTDYALHALDAATGRELWANTDAGFTAKTDIVKGIYYGGKYWLLHHPTSGRYIDAKGRNARGRLFGDGVRNARLLAAFSAAGGKRLFDADLGGNIAGVAFSAGTVYGGSQHMSKGGLAAVDAATGKRKWQLPGHRKCTPVFAAAHCVTSRGGLAQCLDVRQWEKTRSPGALKWNVLSGIRPSCTHPPIPAFGMLYVTGPGCNCPYPIRANVAMYPARPAPPDGGGRLVTGPAFARKIPAAKDTAPWRTWRADLARSAATAAGPADAASFKRLWTAEPAGKPTRLAAAEGLIYAGSDDHRLCAFDARTGERRWRYFAKGRITVAPYYWGGRVYFSDDDGWVHCLAAGDGELIWRFRAAPAVDRVIAYGRIASRWPAGCGVLVQPDAGGDGAAVYFTAGLFPSEKVSAAALDAATGQVRWEQVYTRSGGFVPAGPMALANHRLYVPSGQGRPWTVRLDNKDHSLDAFRAGAYAKELTVAGDRPGPWTSDVVMNPHNIEYVHWRYNYKKITSAHALPLLTADTVYLRTPYLAAEKRQAFKIHRGSVVRRDTRWDPSIVRWRAWPGEAMSAVIKAGDTIFTGGAANVYATAAPGGKQLWSAPVPGAVRDLAFNGGKLMVLCEPAAVVCFGKE